MLKEREQILKSIQALAVKVLLSGALCVPTARYLINPRTKPAWRSVGYGRPLSSCVLKARYYME